MDMWDDIRIGMQHLGQDVRDRRIQKGWSQEQLVKHFDPEGNIDGWHVPTVSLIESGKHVPSPYVAIMLSRWMLQGDMRRHLVAVPSPARTEDPDTSKKNRPTANTGVHRAILQLLSAHGALAHYQICGLYGTQRARDMSFPPATESRIRTAVKELVLTGWVEDTGRTIPNDNGRACILWDRTIDEDFIKENK